MDWQIAGHKKQIEFLENALKRGKLSHAYVFAGPTGVGKKAIARKIAHELLGSQADFIPDLLEIDGHEGIKIEQIRELIYKLSLKPYSAKYKVAIIDSVEQMTIEAANALLKNLEEPKPDTIIILITSNAERLPKTILSRCQKINFGPIENSVEASDEFYRIFRNNHLEDKLIAAYQIAELETGEIKNLLDSWLSVLQRELQIKASQTLAQKISQVMLSRKFLDQNVNVKLLLTNLMLNA